MVRTKEQEETVRWIKNMPSEEVAMYVDEASRLYDLWLEDIVWGWYRYDKSVDPTIPHRSTGWVPARTVAEVMVSGTTEAEAKIQYLANLGLIRPRAEWLQPDEDFDVWRGMKREEIDEIMSGFDFDYYFAVGTAMGALIRLKNRTNWIENEKDWGWRLTPEGLAHLDGVLDQVVALEI